ncbi:DUF29 domain-containing protein [Aphanothece hegewaldii CCALA 016]|uniref:DUF29 domain-containing protein n=1 Tax=Aphanothece hegewaldii CCALA 016 TaxID=2107694 RepID=A0A2T1LRR0_9CHRO|nr:DUF29 domain-containing protein [Aphanothece hegewaldii]PSF31441.1 DUF29 domain-containing protein [Aphanothece hegewaldii CCALA 016]
MSIRLPTSQTLYQQDFYLWINTTIEQIRSQHLESVDWEHLLEELEDLGNAPKHKLESRLLVLLEHLLKLAYWSAEREYNARRWKGTIIEQRKQLKKLLKNNPSLKPYLTEVFEETYQDARDIVIVKTELASNVLPIQPAFTLEQVLDESWLPNLD